MGRNTFSRYEIFERPSGKRLEVTASIIDEFALKDHLKRQEVHFSPSGQTIVIDEDASDASDWVNYILISRRSAADRYFVERLELPVRQATSPYGEWPIVVSVTDSEVFFHYPDDTEIRRKVL